MLSVFGFDFFGGFYLCDFSGFCRSTFVRFRFWKITLQLNLSELWVNFRQPRIARIY